MSRDAEDDSVVDWAALVDGLRRHGFPLSEVSRVTGVSITSLKEYRLAIKSPLHATGERLIVYWCGVTNSTREQLPRTRRIMSAATVA
jgi:lambda repressor-like predicted transcriptional regulator